MIGTSLLAAGLLFAAPDDADLLADDLEFAKNLAVHRYFDIARGVVSDVRRAADRQGNDDAVGEADLTEARMLMLQAQSTADPVESMQDRDRAIELLSDWAKPGSGYAYHDRLVDALQYLSELLRDRGMAHGRAFAEGVENARKAAEADFKAAEDVLTTLQQEAEGLAEQFEELGQEDNAAQMRARAAQTLYFRGVNSIEWSDVSDDPAFRLERAYDYLDDFQWEQEDENLETFKAMYQMARAMEKSGDLDETTDLLANILDRLGTEYWAYCGEDADPEYRFPPVAERQIADLLAQVWGYLARLSADQGDLEGANTWVDTLLEQHQTKGIRIGRTGFVTLIDWARTLDQLGQTRRATEIVKIVTDGARGTAEGQIAEVMLAELVSSGGEQSPDVLMQAARGHVTNRNWADAAFTYERAAAGLASADDLRQMGYDAWMGAGKALRLLSRHLEAAVAFEMALEIGQAHAATDDQLEVAASQMYGAYDSRYKETGDAFDKQLRDAASQRLVNMPGIELDLAYMSAREAFDAVGDDDVQGFLAVRADLEGVPASSPNYEKALVLSARALAGAGRVDEALAAFEAVEARDDDPDLAPTNATGRKRRQAAMAQARYYHADLLLQDDVARPADALAVLDGFEEELDEQASMFPQVKYKRVVAHAMAGAVDEGEAALQDLIDVGASNNLVSGAAYKLAISLESAARVAGDLGDPGRKADLLSRAADAMWTYSEKAGHSSVTNLLGTGEWYLEAGDPAAAEPVFDTALTTIRRTAGVSTSTLERARIGLATALDEQRDFGRSRPIWKELYASNPKSVDIRRGAARCFGGWLEMGADGATIVEVKGSGDFSEAVAIWTDLAKGYRVQAKYTREWWEAQLGAVYGFYNQRNIEPDKAAAARKVIDSLKLSQPRFDQDTVGNLPPEQQYEPLLRPYFQYLDRLLPER